MKILLNIIIYTMIFLIWSDLERNSAAKTLDYSRTIYCLSGLLFFGFFRVYINDFTEYIKRIK